MSIIHKGRKLSDEHKLKISIANKGRQSPNKNKKFSTEHRKKLSESHKGLPGSSLGKKHSNATKAKISTALTGIKLSDERKKQISIRLTGNTCNLGRKQSLDTINKKTAKLNKPIIAFDKDGNKTCFQSIKLCSETLGISGGYISECLKGKWENAKGYTFKRIKTLNF